MSGELRVPIPSAIVCDTRVILVMSPGSPSWSSMEGSSNAYSIAMSVIAHVICALLSESRTREGLDTEGVILPYERARNEHIIDSCSRDERVLQSRECNVLYPDQVYSAEIVDNPGYLYGVSCIQVGH